MHQPVLESAASALTARSLTCTDILLQLIKVKVAKTSRLHGSEPPFMASSSVGNYNNRDVLLNILMCLPVPVPHISCLQIEDRDLCATIN